MNDLYSMGVENNGVWTIRKKIYGIGGRQYETIFVGNEAECKSYWNKYIV